jgi:hypothetical protein
MILEMIILHAWKQSNLAHPHDLLSGQQTNGLTVECRVTWLKHRLAYVVPVHFFNLT